MRCTFKKYGMDVRNEDENSTLEELQKDSVSPYEVCTWVYFFQCASIEVFKTNPMNAVARSVMLVYEPCCVVNMLHQTVWMSG